MVSWSALRSSKRLSYRPRVSRTLLGLHGSNCYCNYCIVLRFALPGVGSIGCGICRETEVNSGRQQANIIRVRVQRVRNMIMTCCTRTISVASDGSDGSDASDTVFRLYILLLPSPITWSPHAATKLKGRGPLRLLEQTTLLLTILYYTIPYGLGWS